MEIRNHSIQSVDTVQSISQQKSEPALLQKNHPARHNDVPSLSREGEQAQLPQQLTQQSIDAEGNPVAKQKHKKSFSLKNMMKFGKSKSETKPASFSQPTQQNSGKHTVSAENRQAEKTPDALKQANTEVKSTQNSWISKLGFKSHQKAKEKNTGDQSAENTLAKEKYTKPESPNSLRHHFQTTTPSGEPRNSHLPAENTATSSHEPEVYEESPDVEAFIKNGLQRTGLPTIPESEFEGIDSDDEYADGNPASLDNSRGKLPGSADQQITQRPGKELAFHPSHSLAETGETSGSGIGRSSSSSALSTTTSASDSATAATGTLVPPQLGIEKGKLTIGQETPASLATILKETMGRDAQKYTLHESHNQGQEQLLLDKQGRVFQMNTNSQTGIVALHTSTPVMNPDARPASLLEHLSESGHPAASENLLALATGVHTDQNGDHWRIHDGKLHQLSPQGEWQSADSEVKTLATGGDARLYGLKNNHQLVDMATQQSSVAAERNIASFSLNQEGEVALLLKPEGETPQILRFSPTLTAESGRTLDVTPQYDAQAHPELQQSSPELTTIGMSGDKLFAVDKDNQLLAASLPKEGQSTLQFTVLDQPELQNAFGKDVQFEGFTHQDDGQISLLIKDHNDQRHSCPINESGVTFKPGWNLSDVLHIDNQQGLETLDTSHLHAQEFEKQGAFTIADGKLYAKDQLTQQWTKAADNVDSLIRGQNGQPYALQKGELKTITFVDKSDTIGYGDDNVFSLTQSRGSVGLDSGPKGLPGEKLKSAAVIDGYQHVTLTESNELKHTQIRSGTNTPMVPTHTIDTRGIEGEISQIGTDQNERLYALTKEGKLFSLSAQDWKKPQDSQSHMTWSPEPSEELGDTQGAQLGLSKDRQLTLTTASGDLYVKQGDKWQAVAPAEPEQKNSVRNELFDNLSAATKGFKVTKGGVQYKVAAQLGGLMGMETNKVSSKFTARLKAHVFNPTLETPRPVKIAAYSVQHQWKGREGLGKLYKQESKLYSQLEEHNEQIKTENLPKRSTDIQTRLSQLNLGEAGQSLKDDLEAFRQELETSAERQLTKLGIHQGVLKPDGEINKKYRPSKVKDFAQQANTSRSGHDLSDELLTSWRHLQVSPDSKVKQMLKDFTAMKVNMSHQKTEVPMGRQRDPNDDMALAKARLVLDTMMLRQVDQLVEKAGLLSDTNPEPELIDSLKQDLSRIRDKSYEQNRVKHYTDQGMVSHKDVEAGYDAAKFFIKAFSKEDHGVNLLTRAALKAQDKTELSQKLAGLMHSLKPTDNIAITRSYSAEGSVTFTPTFMQDKFISMFPSAGGGQSRNYGFELDAVDDGVMISITGNLGVTGRGNLGINKNILPYAADSSADSLKIPLNDGHQTFKPDFVVGAGLTAGGRFAHHNELKFTVREADIDKFAESLVNGTITPDELVDQGMEHVTMSGSKYDFSVDLGLNVAARARLDFTDADENPTFMARAGGGVSAGLNLFSTKRDKLEYHGIENSKYRDNNKTGVLNTASAGADIGLTAGINIATEDGDVTAFANARTAASVSVENAVKTRGELKSKHAEPVTAKDINKLCDSLGGQFTDPVSKQVLEDVKGMQDLDAQFAALSSHFLDKEKVTAKNDKQHAALLGISKTETQHLAASRGAEVMSEVKAVVSHSNPTQLDRPGVLNFLLSLIAPSKKDALAEQIHTMIQEDPIVGKVIDDIRARPNVVTWVTMELKDELRTKMEKDFALGKMTMADAQKAMQDPENRRLKSISFFETGEHKEGFSSPTLFVGGSSSANIYMERIAGAINFKYGADQDVPRSYTLGGEIVTAQPEIAQAVSDLKKDGLAVKS